MPASPWPPPWRCSSGKASCSAREPLPQIPSRKKSSAGSASGARTRAGIAARLRLMRAHFGHLHWWPGETPFEVCVGAILTQNTSWSNVERAIANLKAARVLEPRKLFALSESQLAALIRPGGLLQRQSPAAALVPAGAGRGIRRGPWSGCLRGRRPLCANACWPSTASGRRRRTACCSTPAGTTGS